MSAVAPDVSLDELMGRGDEDHLICGCRPQFTLCGGYNPTNVTVVYSDAGPNDCAACTRVWNTSGCGVCLCNANYGCGPCVARYFASID